MTPCTHGMPTPLACVECMANGNIPPPTTSTTRPVWSRPTEARWPGRCIICDDHIDTGDLIRTRRGTHIAHDGCAIDAGADG